MELESDTVGGEGLLGRECQQILLVENLQKSMLLGPWKGLLGDPCSLSYAKSMINSFAGKKLMFL